MHFPDPEHFFPAADPGQCYRLPRAVRQRESHGDRWAGDCGDGGEHGGGGGVLQDDGKKVENTKALRLPGYSFFD